MMESEAFRPLSKREIQQAIDEFNRLASAARSSPPEEFESAFMDLFHFCGSSPVLQAAFADFAASLDRALQRAAKALEVKETPDPIDLMVVMHFTLSGLADRTKSITEVGVQTFGESKYDAIVARMQGILYAFTAQVSQRLQATCDGISRKNDIPATWLTLVPPDLPDGVKSRVQEILREFPQARSDDKRLIYEYLKRWHGIELPQSVFKESVPAFETIRRSRQIIQKEGLFRGDSSQLRLDFDDD